jgi:acetyl-CoA synthetase
MLPDIRDYSQLYRQFRWQVPAAYNIGVDVCDRWAAVDARRTAIVHVRADGTSENISFGSLRETSNRLANALSAHGIKRGDRVAILLPQAPEVVASHVAVYKLGAVVLPIAVVFGVDALAYRLQNSGAAALITNAAGAAKVAAIRGEAPALKLVQLRCH